MFSGDPSGYYCLRLFGKAGVNEEGFKIDRRRPRIEPPMNNCIGYVSQRVVHNLVVTCWQAETNGQELIGFKIEKFRHQFVLVFRRNCQFNLMADLEHSLYGLWWSHWINLSLLIWILLLYVPRVPA